MHPRLDRVSRRAVMRWSSAVVLPTGGAALRGLGGPGSVVGELQDALHLSDVLGAGYDPASDDAAPGLVVAAHSAARARKTLVVSGRLRLETCAAIENLNDLHIHFDDAVIDALDQGTNTKLSNGAAGQVAFHFRRCDRLRLSGNAQVNGQGSIGNSALGGIVYDTLLRPDCDVSWSLDNMAGGVFALWCDHGKFGDLAASRMQGRQVFDVGSAGSALVAAGCFECSFGRITSHLNYKPVLYCSVMTTPEGARSDNERCSFGLVQGTPAPSSIEGSLITLRSALDCTFVGATGVGFSHGLLVTRYASDKAHKGVDGNVVGYITGSFASTGSSLDGAVIQELGDTEAPPIGANIVTRVDAICAGECGVSVSTGSMSFETIRISGSTRPVELKNSVVRAGTIICENQGQEAVTIARGADLRVSVIDVRTGSGGGVSSAVRYDPTYPGPMGRRSTIDIGEIRYARNGVGKDVMWVYMDLSADGGSEAQHIGHIRGTGSSAQARFGRASYSIDRGRVRTVAPSPHSSRNIVQS